MYMNVVKATLGKGNKKMLKIYTYAIIPSFWISVLSLHNKTCEVVGSNAMAAVKWSCAR